MQDGGLGTVEGAQRPDDLRPGLRMTPHESELGPIEARRLVQDDIGNRDLAQVVVQASEADRFDIALGHAHRPRHRHGPVGDAVKVHFGVVVPSLHCPGERHKNGLVAHEVVCQTLRPQQRADPDQQLFEVERLGQEFVGTSLERP